MLAAVALVSSAGHSDASFNNPDPIPGNIRFAGIDADVSGNTSTHVATYESARYVHPGQTFTIDFVVDEIDPSDGVTGFDAKLSYTTSLQVLSIDTGSLVFAAPGTGTPFYFNDPLPDTDGEFKFAIQDLGGPAESGEGVLARITLKCNSANTAVLSVDDISSSGDTQPSIYDQNVNAINIFNEGSATILCGTSPTPTTPFPTCSPLPGHSDCDGVPDASDNCPFIANSQENDDGDTLGDVCDNCPSWTNQTQVTPIWPIPSSDRDCDGFPDYLNSGSPLVRAGEAFVGTAINRQCALDTIRNNENPDRWPVDMDDNRIVSGPDLLAFGPVFGAISPNPPYVERFDINSDGRISGPDLLKFGPFFALSCSN